jgi:hypothetical protein
MADNELIYRVIFLQADKQYEIYAKYISEESLMGFIEVEEIVFGNTSDVVVDPSEERLKNEFKGVVRFYVPMHQLIRIDEVTDRGVARIREASAKSANIMSFPSQFKTQE